MRYNRHMSDDRLNQILEKLTAIESRQSNIEQGIINLGKRVEALETDQTDFRAVVESRLPDMRPIWEAVQTQISQLHSDMTDQFSKLNKKLDILNRELLDVKAEQERHGDRLDTIERKAS